MESPETIRNPDYIQVSDLIDRNHDSTIKKSLFGYDQNITDQLVSGKESRENIRTKSNQKGKMKSSIEFGEFGKRDYG